MKSLTTPFRPSFRVDAKTGDLAEISRIPYPDPGPTDPHGNTWTGGLFAGFVLVTVLIQGPAIQVLRAHATSQPTLPGRQF